MKNSEEYSSWFQYWAFGSILACGLLLATVPPKVFGSERSVSAMKVVQTAREECAGFESGRFNMAKHAISLHDVTGDGRPEEVIDAAKFSCSTAASLWGGSGGTYLWVIVDGKAHEFLAHKWRIVDVDGQKILLLAVHSSECSDTIGPCYRALVWSDGFRTIR